MNNHRSTGKETEGEMRTILVAVDFSDCSRQALKKALELARDGETRIVVLHVIDQEFIAQCLHHRLGSEAEIKKELFLEAKRRLKHLVNNKGRDGLCIDTAVCEGMPFIEINKMAADIDAEMIIIGSRGKADDMEAIFFGSTAEKVLRFITKPVLCVPPEKV